MSYLPVIVLHNIAVKNRDMFNPLPLGLVHQPGGEDEDNTNVGGTSTRNYYVENYFS